MRRARQLEETQAFHAQRHIINGSVGGHDGAARWAEGQADDAAADDDDLGIVLGGAIDWQTQHAATSATLQDDYSDCWKGLEKKFDPTKP